MEQKLISIIIPVYNAEKTLRSCLDSVKKQNYSKYEVIIIDDGSNDKSAEICKDYCNKDSRFRLYKQKNGGPSKARNKGLDEAEGDYIAFLDSDDYLQEEYLNTINTAASENPDLIFIAFNRVNSEGKLIKSYQLPDYKREFKDMVISLSKEDMFGYTWIKVIKRDIIKNVRFNNEMKIFEDEVFICDICQDTRKIYLLNKPIYNYVRGEEETLFTKVHYDYVRNCNLVYQAWTRMLKDEHFEILEEKANHMVNNCFWYGLEKKVNTINFYRELKNSSFFIKSTLENKFIKYIRKDKWNYIRVLCMKYRLKIFIAKLLNRK